jgi:osmotically-inducible protein OsmY
MKYLLVAVCCTLAIGCNEAFKADRTDVNVKKPVSDSDKLVDRNNTAVNVRDRDQATKTPIDQNENKSDVTTTADIRKRVMDGKMSVEAQNVKIITQNGKVTLRGPVKSAAEKQRIEDIANDVAGAGNVDTQLEVEAPK